jgi:hypothetical protein
MYPQLVGQLETVPKVVGIVILNDVVLIIIGTTPFYYQNQ